MKSQLFYPGPKSWNREYTDKNAGFKGLTMQVKQNQLDIQDIMPDNCAKVDKVLVVVALGCAISGWYAYKMRATKRSWNNLIWWWLNRIGCYCWLVALDIDV